MTHILCYAVHSFEQEIPSMKAQAEKLEEAIRLGVERCKKKKKEVLHKMTEGRDMFIKVISLSLFVCLLVYFIIKK